ncbi:MAG: 23S rRNA (adenine(2503)-C(2))-methyltransferase RlmN [Bacillota bacterium]|jgi:23S rRNA (adenine2503-C2)-methyltransferase
MARKAKLIGMTPAEMRGFCAQMGQPAFRAKQILAWIYQQRCRNFQEMTNLPADWRARLPEQAVLFTTQILKRQQAADGTVKFLVGLRDGQAVETVLMRYAHGNSACVSAQVGCKMGCAFCASGLGGWQRDLTAGEMMEQVLWAQGEDGRVSHVVLMGTGEPLDNYDQVLKFLGLLHDPLTLGISLRRVTVSTAGLVPGIKRLANEKLPVTLAVSLHAARDELRDRLVPINRRYPLRELLLACAEYEQSTGRRVTFEYALFHGVNDGPQDALALADLVRGRHVHVNLIRYNPVPELDWPPATESQTRTFAGWLEKAGVNATVRRRLGLEIDAACGQLRRRQWEGGGRR